jgi:hypothetical protein
MYVRGPGHRGLWARPHRPSLVASASGEAFLAFELFDVAQGGWRIVTRSLADACFEPRNASGRRGPTERDDAEGGDLWHTWDIAVRIDVIYETPSASVATWRDAVIFTTRTAILEDALQAYVHTTNQLVREQQRVAALCVIGEKTKLPDQETVRAIRDAMRTCLATCTARVIPGQGLWATAIRGMMTSAQEGSVAAGPRETFGSIHEAAAWLGAAMGKESAWSGQLATLTGTLLYGSPSWGRASQMAPYLVDDDDELEP